MPEPTPATPKPRDSIGCGTVALFATLLLVILKLAGVLDWPWLAVFAPAFAFIGLVVSSIGCFLLCVAVLLAALAALWIAAAILDAIANRKGKP